MLKIEKTCVMNIENAIRGARNPMNSWAKSDSFYDNKNTFILGENDLQLAKKLCAAGSDHRKFIRQIFVSVDITAPLYWWKEFDTYKVGTVSNSTSTMHRIHSKAIEITDFSTDRLTGESLTRLESYVSYIELVRLRFVESGNKMWWDDIIQLLPSSYNQLRTVSLNYENLTNMYGARKRHKLGEWITFCQWIESLPYAQDLIINEEADNK